MNRSSHYAIKKRILREHTPCYSISEDYIEKLTLVARYENQTPSRILEGAINFFLYGEKNEEIYKKIKAAQKCYKKTKTLSVTKKQNFKNKIYCQKTPNIPKLFS